GHREGADEARVRSPGEDRGRDQAVHGVVFEESVTISSLTPPSPIRWERESKRTLFSFFTAFEHSNVPPLDRHPNNRDIHSLFPLPSDGTTVRKANVSFGETNSWRAWEATGSG